jgi:glycosyl transferase family 25
MDFFQIPAFCITLDPKSTKRALPTLEQIKSIGFEKAEFFPGVDLRKKKLIDVKDLVSTRAYEELSEGRYTHEGLSGLGSVGCYLAHLGLWKKCVELDTPIAIFEDDLFFTPDAKEKIQKAYTSAVENNYDILRIIYRVPSYFSYEKTPEKISSTLSRTNRGVSTEAYIITPKAALLAVKYAMPMEMHCDHYLDLLSKKYGLNCFFMKDSVKLKDRDFSTLDHSKVKTYYEDSPKKENDGIGTIGKVGILLAILALIIWWKNRGK